jgi:ribosomal protein S18 acetylase RimI-like enzyme
VLPECRGRGIGRRLLEAVLSQARSIEGVRHVTLSVNAANTPARRLYQSLGFVCYGLEPAALCVDGAWHDEEYYLLVLDAHRPINS